MPNHVLVEIGAISLAKAMQILFYRYTLYYNRRYRNVGHLFQGRHKAILCDRESYLLDLIRYIHLNPVRSGMASDPTRYAWSSHGVYMRGKAEKGVAVDKVLPLFSARRGITGYEQFVLDGLSQGSKISPVRRLSLLMAQKRHTLASQALAGALSSAVALQLNCLLHHFSDPNRRE